MSKILTDRKDTEVFLTCQELDALSKKLHAKQFPLLQKDLC